MLRSANTGAYSATEFVVKKAPLYKQISKCFKWACFFHILSITPCVSSRRVRCTGRETTAPKPYIFYGFLRVKDGFPTGKIRVPKMKVLKRLKKYGFLRVKDGFPTDKRRVHCWNLPFSLKNRQCSFWMQFSFHSSSRLIPICQKWHLVLGLGAGLQMFPTGQVIEYILHLGELYPIG